MHVNLRHSLPVHGHTPQASDETILIALEIILGTLFVGGCVVLALASGVNVVSSLAGVGGSGAALLAVAVTATYYCTRKQNGPQRARAIQPEPVALNSSRRVLQPNGEATLHIMPTITTLIGDDREFNFRGRLKDQTKAPIQIKPSDFAVALDGKVTSGNIDRLHRNACNEYCIIRLPSVLFQNVGEGELILFYCDDQLFKIRCCQRNSPYNQYDFPQALSKAARAPST
ncbi:MAG: hypothetical protein S4CHLAM2_17500 [Chlamydiales bacterium]|nr:hypothetical protein [Chlamydiales bacterium]